MDKKYQNSFFPTKGELDKVTDIDSTREKVNFSKLFRFFYVAPIVIVGGLMIALCRYLILIAKEWGLNRRLQETSSSTKGELGQVTDIDSTKEKTNSSKPSKFSYVASIIILGGLVIAMSYMFYTNDPNLFSLLMSVISGAVGWALLEFNSMLSNI